MRFGISSVEIGFRLLSCRHAQERHVAFEQMRRPLLLTKSFLVSEVSTALPCSENVFQVPRDNKKKIS